MQKRGAVILASDRRNALLRNTTLVAVLALFCWDVAGADRRATTFFVATDGNDAWSGTLPAPNAARTDGPFASLAAARDAVRRLKASSGLRCPVKVLVREGTYFLREPFRLEPRDSGTAQYLVTYEAYEGEKPVISGGRAVVGWRKGKGRLWCADIPDTKSGHWYFRQLFVDGERRTRARTPSHGYLYTTGPRVRLDRSKRSSDPETKMGFRYRKGDVRRWRNLDDVNIVLYHSWTTSVHWIASLNEEDCAVRFTHPTDWPVCYWAQRQRYYVENGLEALDAPGEWYLDRNDGVLHYWPLDGEDLTKASVIAPVLSEIVRFAGEIGQDGERVVEYVSLRGLSFQHADWDLSDRLRSLHLSFFPISSLSAIHSGDVQASPMLGAAVFVVGARHCTIAGCEIAHAGEHGLWLERGCRDNRVLRCHIHDLGAGGVYIGESQSPSSPSRAVLRNTLDNSVIRDGGHVFRGGVGVWIGRSSHNAVTHNEICDFSYTGVSVGWDWGYSPSSANHNTVAHNHIHHIGNGVLSDLGGIYTLGVSTCTQLRHNHIHDVYSHSYGGWGIYLDQASSGIAVEGNVVHTTKSGGFHHGYGRENVVRNNIFAFSEEPQIRRSREEEHISFYFERNIVCASNPNVLMGRWANGNYRVDHNLYWGTSGDELRFDGGSFEEWQSRGSDQHSVIADPGFVDLKGRRFRLSADSPALRLGFVPVDTGESGLYGERDWVNTPKALKHRSIETANPPPPIPMEDDFERLAIGGSPVEAQVYTEGEHAGIGVTDETAATGRHSLKFIDAPGMEHKWNPHLVYNPYFAIGKARFSCDIKNSGDAPAEICIELRDWRRSPFRVGPTMRIMPNGELKAGGQSIASVPLGQWIHLEVTFGLGDSVGKTYELKLTWPGIETQTLKVPYGSPDFAILTWLGFISESEGRTVFYVDNVRLAPLNTE